MKVLEQFIGISRSAKKPEILKLLLTAGRH
jgi:hypothetical protein